MTEVWRDVAGYKGRYQVSDMGRVRSLRFINRNVNRLRQHPKLKALRPAQGYLNVTLYADGKRTGYRVHRLVLEAFVGPRPKGYECAHDDGDRRNNRLSNLAWKTNAENHADMIRHGRMPMGSRHHITTLTEADVLDIRRLRIIHGWSDRVLAARFNVKREVVERILRGQTWKHVKLEDAVMADIDSVRRHLLSGQSLTAADALRLFGCSRLAGRIHDLKGQGLDIETETVEVPKRGGRTARVTRYRLKRTAGELFE